MAGQYRLVPGNASDIAVSYAATARRLEREFQLGMYQCGSVEFQRSDQEVDLFLFQVGVRRLVISEEMTISFDFYC